MTLRGSSCLPGLVPAGLHVSRFMLLYARGLGVSFACPEPWHVSQGENHLIRGAVSSEFVCLHRATWGYTAESIIVGNMKRTVWIVPS
jgi:hypothetical protein